MKAFKKLLILIIGVIPLLVLIGYGSWIIIKNIDFELPFFPVEKVIYQYFNDQKVTYNGNVWLPSSDYIGKFDDSVSDNLSYEYKIDNDIDSYHSITSETPGPIHAGKYKFRITYTVTIKDENNHDINKEYIVDDISFEILKANPTVTFPTITSKTIIENKQLTFSGGTSNVSGTFELDSEVLYNNGNPSNSKNSSCKVKFKFTPDKINGYDDYNVIYSSESINLTVMATVYNKTTNLYYGSIERALLAANNGSTDEMTIIPGLDPIIVSNCEIPSGDTLTIPYEFDESSKTSKWNGRKSGSTFESGNTINTFADSTPTNIAKYLKSTVEIADSCILTINGNLNLGGILGNESIGLSGHTAGNYAQLILNNNSQIILNGNSILNCMGYIKTNKNSSFNENDYPLIVNSNATINAPFVIYDYRGGSSTVGAYNNTDHSIFPFNVFDMPNIQVYTKINSGAKIYGYVDIYTSQVVKEVTQGNASVTATIKARHNNAEFSIINTSGALINQSSGYIIYKYIPSYNSQKNNQYDIYGYTLNNTTNGISNISVYGNIVFGNIRFSIDMFDEIQWANKGLLGPFMQQGAKAALNSLDTSFDTRTIKFPISWKYKINYKSGIFTLNNHIKLLTGASLEFDENTTMIMNSNSSFIAYSAFKDDSSISPQYPSKESAVFKINGTLTNNGASLGGLMTTSNSLGMLNLSSANSLSISSDEGTGGWGISGLSIAYTFKAISSGPIVEQARGYISNESINNFEKSNYKSQDSYWLKN